MSQWEYPTDLSFASVPDPSQAAWNGGSPYLVMNHVNGTWTATHDADSILDPLSGEPFLQVASASKSELAPFYDSLKAVPKTGLHNPFRNVDRYVMLGNVSSRAAAALRRTGIATYFAEMIMRVSPKSFAQAYGEVNVCAKFLDNFSGDNVRFLARSFGVPGDRDGQESRGYRFPYGPVAIITPFNFPLEIPVLQVMAALYMGNKPVVKVDSKVSVVMEQFLRLLFACGLPPEDVDFLNCDGPTMNHFLVRAQPRMTLFTGSSRVADKLAKDLRGKLKIEDAGFNWKILGPDVRDIDYVAWTCDQDAYACAGQKCSAQSLLFAHKNWMRAGLVDRLTALAQRRSLDDLTCGPTLTWTTEAIIAHVRALLDIPGARLLFGGSEMAKHRIPECYGAMQPTAVFVPLKRLLMERHFETATKELFGPVQVVTEYSTRDVPSVLRVMEALNEHLTAAVVSNDPDFTRSILGASVNGTTYVGVRARTTGAPQNHWFGPAGDPRGAGIGTREAIQLVWSCHREVIHDTAAVPDGWKVPPAT